jgi:hypothetical protein
MKWPWCVAAGVAALGAGCISEDVGDVKATVHGRIKADVAYDTAQTEGGGNYVYWVDDDQAGGDNLSVTARESRIALAFSRGERLAGKVEVDFYGAGSAENKPTIMLRHLFAKVKLDETWCVLFGQTSDVFSPLVPSTLNYPVAWKAGNVGYRRPQVRLECATGGFISQIALARPIDGEESAAPDWQGRLAYAHKDAEDRTTFALGMSGVTGFRDDGRDVHVEGSAIDLRIALGSKFELSGEAFTGRNLSGYLGGIGQGLNNNGEEIGSTGMWVQLGARLTDAVTLNVGYHFDDPDRDDLTGQVADPDASPAIDYTDNRDRNTCVFVNLRKKLDRDIEIGIEYSTWRTLYWDGSSSSEEGNSRVHTSLIVTF